MRVIAGCSRNTRLECPPGNEVRPMLEKVRGAVFNIFNQVTPGATVLDLFAGCGSLGVEALSRGAAWCVFVERNPEARRFLEANLARAKLAASCDVIQGDVYRCVSRLKRLGRKFRLLLVDPPYDVWADAQGRARVLETLDSLSDEGLLAGRPWFVIHHDPRSPAPESTRTLAFDEQRRYGRSAVSIYALKGAAPAEEGPAETCAPENTES
ncbi:MAG TPA: RsmD family RNA methyltransferase [Candidatus Brocadiia bacterium]|nr:RsmD family RNA methyltransferase [Candidatus Brocadiia bacterium]